MNTNNSIRMLTLACVCTMTACQSQTHYQIVYPMPEASSPMSQSSKSDVESSSAPTSVLIRVPFATQAPLANWDPLHEEACEEASLILVNRYLHGQAITSQEMEDEIQKLVAWETDHGYQWDVTTEELKNIARDVYGLSGTVLTDVTVDTIKRQIAVGRPVIVPLAGREVNNPYYSGEGPWYHMLVIVGYDNNAFITNDVGTKRGEGYRYDADRLASAIHDWNGANETIDGGRKAMLVLSK